MNVAYFRQRLLSQRSTCGANARGSAVIGIARFWRNGLPGPSRESDLMLQFLSLFHSFVSFRPFRFLRGRNDETLFRFAV